MGCTTCRASVPVQYSYTSTSPMDCTTCRASVPVQGCTLVSFFSPVDVFKSQLNTEPHMLKYNALDIYRYRTLSPNHPLYQRKGSRSSHRNRRWFHRHSRQRQVTSCQESLPSPCQARASNCPLHPHYVCVDCLSVSRALRRMLVPVFLIHRGMRLLTCYYIDCKHIWGLRCWMIQTFICLF